MHGDGGLLVLALVLIGVPGFFTVRAVARRRGTQGQPRPRHGGWFQRRHEVRMEKLKQFNAMVREAARHKNKLTEQEERDARAARYGASPAAAGGDGEPGTRHSRRQTVRATVTRLGDKRAPASPGDAAGGRPGAPGRPDDPPGAPEPRRPPEPPVRDVPVEAPPPTRPAPGNAAPPPAPPRSESPTLEGVVVTIQPDNSAAIAVPGVEDIIEGAAALRRHAMSGNAQAKRRAVLGIAAGIDVLAATLRTLSSGMSEPGQHYGPEITEPLTGAGSHLTAGATTLTEIDGRLLAIIRAAEELAASGVQAPHHEQMTAR